MKKLFFAPVRTGIAISVAILFLSFTQNESFFERMYSSLRHHLHQQTNQAHTSTTAMSFNPGATCTGLAADAIGGNVWEDFNYDGDKSTENNVYGVAGIQVDLYNSANQQVGSEVTDSDGNYVFSNLSETDYRVEFVIPESRKTYTKGTVSGANSQTTVQFVAVGNCADLGVANPGQYCDTNPYLITPCFVSGEPSLGGSAGIGDVLVSYPNAGGATKADVNMLALNRDIGSTWGIAYAKTSKDIYAAAMMKRHAGFGPLGIGGIYKVNHNDPANPVIENWLDLGTEGVNIGSNPRSYQLPAESDASSTDPAGFDAVGKLGLGDIDISEDEKTLYVINLNNNGALVEIDIATKSVTKTTPISNPGATNASDVRPWGLSVHKGNVYVGSVASGQTGGGASMRFFIQKYDGTSFTTILNESLNYEKGYIHVRYNKPDAPEICKNWETWTADFNDIHTAGLSREGPRWCRPQPILSDIEFDYNGDMIIAFMDRTGHQTGYLQANTDENNLILGNGYIGGEILRVANSNGTFILENGGTTVKGGGAGLNNQPGDVNGDTIIQGPGGGEYYAGDLFLNLHQETSLGGMVLSPTGNTVALNVMDPTDYYTGGTMWLNNTTGESDRVFELYSSNNLINPANNVGTFGKAAGLGDLELTCAPAPIEIGNYVWNDANSDGIQNPNEVGLDGIAVELIKNGVKIASTTTSNGGQYYFSADGATNQTWETTNDQVLPAMEYCIRIALTEGGLNSSIPTLTNSDNSDNGDARDSDATTADGYAKITFTTGGAGETNHDLDFGFTSKLCIGDYVWLDKNADGIQNDSESGIAGLSVELLKNNAVVATTTTNDDGLYFFTIDGAENQTWVTQGDKVLPLMDYTVRIELDQVQLAKHKLTKLNQTDDEKDSDGVVAGAYAVINLTSGTPESFDHQYDFGFRPTLCIGNLVWLDSNNNGIVDNSENGIPSVEVILYQVGGDGTKGTGNDIEIDRKNTDKDGKYLFTNLEEGIYFIKVNDGIPANLTSSNGTSVNGLGASTYEPGLPTSTDIDNDDNGSQMGTMIMTDTFGLIYCKEPITDGDDDFNTNLSIDIGLIPCLSVGNLVFHDLNNDGIYDDQTESPIERVEVQLYSAGANGQKNDDDVLVATETTLADGLYRFDGLKPGNYYVKLNSGIPANMTSSTGEGLTNVTGQGAFEPAPNPDANITDSDDNGSQMGNMVMSDLFNLSIGGESTTDGDNDPNTDLTVDFGLIELMSLGNLVWKDVNNNGLFEKSEKGVAGVEMILFQLGVDGQKATTDDVEIKRDTTDADGHYLFTHLLPGDYYIKLGDGIPLGCGSSTGEGVMDVDGIGDYEQAPDPDTNINDDDNGNQMDYMIMSDVVTLVLNNEPINDGDKSNQSNLSVDFGLFQLLRLGNLVWEDLNNDGDHDADEPGISGVETILYQVGPDGIKGNEDDVEIDRMTTDSAGHYIFVRLLPGEYYVKLNSGIDNFSSSTGEGISEITGNGIFETAPDPDNDVDEEDNGNQMGAMVMSDLIMLEFMREPSFEDSYVNSNFTLDFGLFQPLAIGNLVWNDKNNNGLVDANEPGIPGVTVQLFNVGADGQKSEDDILIDQMNTGTNGGYNFTNLKPGNYYIKLSSFPTNFISSNGAGTGQLSGTGPYEPAPATNNDINADDNGSQMGGMVMSDIITLELYNEPINDGDTDRKTNLAVDFGLLKVNQIKIHNPCTCLNNESGPNAGDGQFTEQIVILSNLSQQIWSVMAAEGAYNTANGLVVPGAVATESGIEDGQYRYVFDVRHVDGKGYTIKFSNGADNLTASNLCHYEQSCHYSTQSPICADCTPGSPQPDPCMMTFIIGADDMARVDSLNCCDNKSSFTDDGTIDGLYEDSLGIPRNDLFTICPQNQWQQLYYHFSEFNVAENDTLYVYDGQTVSDSLLGKFSGSGVSATGGWVASTCSPAKNESGCLTFRFATNGDNIKGTGWNGNFICTERDIKLSPPNISSPKLSCEQTTSSIKIIPATMESACGEVLDSQRIVIKNASGRICKDTCLAPDEMFEDLFAIGQYQITYTVKTDITKTVQTVFGVQGTNHICNDLVNIPLSTGCSLQLFPDDILEGPCDIIVDTAYYHITIRGVDSYGTEQVIASGGGKGGNYPVVTKEQFEEYGGSLIADIEKRYYENLTFEGVCNNGVQSLSCRTSIKLADYSGPIFQATTRDTFKVCDIDLTKEGLSFLTTPKVIDNCSSPEVVLGGINILTDGGICDTTRIEVAYVATDDNGNTSSITKNVVLVRAAQSDMLLPNNMTLSCGEDSEATFDDLEKVGVPSIQVGQVKNGVLVPSDTIPLSTEKYICGYILQQKDTEIDAGQCGTKLFRQWDLLDWCAADATGPIALQSQIINLQDTLAPTFVVEEDTLPFTTLDLDHFSCTYDVTKLPKPAATDLCSDVAVKMDQVWRIENNQLRPISSSQWTALDCDSFKVRWVAEDACHEQLVGDTLSQDLIIRDVTKPAVVCADKITVSIGTEEIKMLNTAFDAGSFDACGIQTLEVSRDEENWGAYVILGCEDLHNDVKVYLRAIDQKGNQNTCWTTVVVEDKIAPICSDLPDMTGTCDAQHAEDFGPSTDTNGDGKMTADEWVDMTDEQVNYYNTNYGDPVCSDNAGTCNVLVIEQQYQLITWPCGMLEIKRRYRAIDWMGEGNISDWTEQNIKIEYKANWSITFPTDWVGTCGDAIPDSQPFITNGACDLLAMEMDEKTYIPSGAEGEDACLKVVRTFTIINWCNYEPGDESIQIVREENPHGMVLYPNILTSKGNEKVGKLVYTQILKLVDNEGPVVTIQEPGTCINGVDGDAAPYGVEDLTPGTTPYECDELKTWTATATDCAGEENITWKARIYENGALVKEELSNSISYVVQNKNSYKAEFWAYDGCSNSGGAETEDKKFWDCKKPTPYCLNGLATELMQSGMIQIWAKDLDRGSYDNCTPSDKLDIRIHHLSLGSVPTTLEGVQDLPKQVTLNCIYLGTQTVRLYVIDEEGNWDFCETHVIIQDNMGACDGLEPQASLARIEGTIMDWNGNTVEEVMVRSSNSAEMMTHEGGTYNFDLAMNESYTITPEKDVNPLNGVSTFDLVLISKHILGSAKFTNAYQYIAADVNQSGSVTAFDMVQVRRLILNLQTEFTNNTSWKFVASTYEFTSENPAAEDYNTISSVANLDHDMQMDFTAVKIGDINGNARTNSLMAIESRSTKGTFTINVDDVKVKAGQTYKVDFVTEQLATIEGYQFTLDMGNLQFEQLNNGVTSIENFGLHQIESGWITTSWNQPSIVTPQPSTVLFTMEFTATADGQLSEQLSIIDRPTTVEAYSTEADGELLDVKLSFNHTKALTKSFELYQNHPNPFKNETNISFFLPESSKVILTLRDEMGRLLKEIKADKAAGFNSIQLTNDDLPKGLIYYQISTKFGTQTKKMLNIE